MKNRGVKVVFLVAAAVCFASLLLIKYSQALDRERAEEEGAASPVKMQGVAPSFDLQDWDGGRVTAAEYRGRWLLVNFWATWCPPCAEEMPSMSEFTRRFSSRGLSVLAVSVDDGWDVVKGFFPHGKPSFRVLLNPGRDVAAAFGTVKFPESYLIGPDGTIKAKFIGARDWADRRIIGYFEKMTGLN